MAGLIGSLVVILVHGLVDVPYFKNDLAAEFWILVAIFGMAKNLAGFSRLPEDR